MYNEFTKEIIYYGKDNTVIIVVVYYEEKAWDGARTLHEMLDIPAEMKKYVNNYKMLLVEAREDNLKLRNINNVDLFKLLGDRDR
ncbi:MAG: hypothetical protein K2N51_03345 [Lachnospiraceae bacterium]|nr:hypothetical protein [Lachnospiraceae bacterium]